MQQAQMTVRVLLVEDHPDVAEVTMLMLRHLGADAVHAATAREAIERVSGEAFDLLLADMRLPDGTGLDVIREAARVGGGDAGRGPRPVLLTAYGSTDLLGGEDELMFERMAKPVEMAQLQELLGEVGQAKR